MVRMMSRYLEEVPTDGMGRFLIEDLEPGTYLLLAHTDDSLGIARAIVPGPGDRVRDVIVRVPRPASVVVEGAEQSLSEHFSVLLDGLPVASGWWSVDEPFLVPAGLVTLQLWDGQRTRFRTFDAPPGGTITLDLRGP
jgi:hypothetical protein